MMTTKENVMMYRIANVSDNGNYMHCFDVTIEHIETGKKVVCDCVKVWDEDQYSLAYMFKLIEKGKWEEGMLSDEEICEIEQEGIFDTSDE
jgi:hypothetical protein